MLLGGLIVLVLFGPAVAKKALSPAAPEHSERSPPTGPGSLENLLARVSALEGAHPPPEAERGSLQLDPARFAIYAQVWEEVDAAVSWNKPEDRLDLQAPEESNRRLLAAVVPSFERHQFGLGEFVAFMNEAADAKEGRASAYTAANAKLVADRAATISPKSSRFFPLVQPDLALVLAFAAEGAPVPGVTARTDAEAPLPK